MVYFAIYDKNKNIYVEQTLSVSSLDREENKKLILRLLTMKLSSYLKEK